MNKIIKCSFFKKKLKRLKKQEYPGKIGKKIYNKISEKAWKKWKLEEIKLINEKKLNMVHSSDIKKLENYMIKFLFKKN
ncbi:oxidative damage protection protein [Buchnera aphidicola (Ceratovacuna keduensis)]|uniref:oxidative damage protection protein n=1 Tax=Buchnera aphidicola TaxID=9 RepID=UPI0031B87FAF